MNLSLEPSSTSISRGRTDPWGWYPLIALIGIVPIFGMFFYALLNIMKEAP